jgi:hypothetical protein
MAQTTSISQKELKRQAELVFEGKTLKVMLCDVGISGYTAESTVANWQSVEKTGDGYVRYSAVIPAGAYDSVSGTHKIPDINAEFTATLSYSYDRVILYIDGETYIHSMIIEDPNVTLSTGQTQTYRLSLRQDD